MQPFPRAMPIALALLLLGCGGDEAAKSPLVEGPATPAAIPAPSPTSTTEGVSQRIVASFEDPWAMTFLPDRRLLVTERRGRLFLVSEGSKVPVSGLPSIAASGQIGLHDVVLDPNFVANHTIWLSFTEASSEGERLVVASGTLMMGSSPSLAGLGVVWRATPATTGGHPGSRLAFSPDGRFLFVSTGDRQQGTPAQDLATTIGKIIRINLDGTAASDNPFSALVNARAEIWSLGHRNPYGLVFSRDGRLFSSEMGPSGGDEFNLIVRGGNYGWPLASEGRNYDGSPIPAHSTNLTYVAPLVSWATTIAPAGMIQYKGTRFAGWTDDFILAGLVQQGLVRVRVNDNRAREVGRIALGARIREVEEAPDGSLWVLQDGSPANLIELLPS